MGDGITIGITGALLFLSGCSGENKNSTATTPKEVQKHTEFLADDTSIFLQLAS